MKLRFARSFLWVALACVTLTAGCGAGGGGLVGTWTLDAEALSEMPDFEKMSDQEKQMSKTIMGMMKVEITFGSNGKMTAVAEAMGQKTEYEADYTSTDKGNGVYEIKTTEEDGTPKTVSVELKGDLLFVTDGEQKFPLRRK